MKNYNTENSITIEKIMEMLKEYPNDMDLGKAIRKLLQK
jgi:hypothetical protein